MEHLVLAEPVAFRVRVVFELEAVREAHPEQAAEEVLAVLLVLRVRVDDPRLVVFALGGQRLGGFH